MLPFLFALLCGYIPSIAWLAFWLHEDNNHLKPRWFICTTFASGGIAVILAIYIEHLIALRVQDVHTQYILWAATEEVLKFIVAGFVALITRYNEDPLDAAIYCITVALGFAALENTLFITSAFSQGILAGVVNTNLRFIGASLVHTISSGFVGFALGYTFYKGHIAKIVSVFVGLSAAIALHASFNISIIDGQAGDALHTFAWIWGAVVLLIIFFEELKAVRPALI